MRPKWERGVSALPFRLAAILKAIKGCSARSINKLTGGHGSVWQEESFDRFLRREDNLRQKVEYICQNPVRKNIVRSENEYPWLWREWIEGDVARTRLAGDGN